MAKAVLIWKEGNRYAKAGIMLGDFCSSDQVQLDLFEHPTDIARSAPLMHAIDQINQSGQGQIWFG